NSRRRRRELTVAYVAGAPGRPPNRCTRCEVSMARRRRRDPRPATATANSDRGFGLPAPCRSLAVPVVNTLPPRKLERLVVAGFAISVLAPETRSRILAALSHADDVRSLFGRHALAPRSRIVQEKRRLGLWVEAGASRLGLTPVPFLEQMHSSCF